MPFELFLMGKDVAVGPGPQFGAGVVNGRSPWSWNLIRGWILPLQLGPVPRVLGLEYWPGARGSFGGLCVHVVLVRV